LILSLLVFAGHVLFLKIAELVPRHPNRTGKAKTPAITAGASGSGSGASAGGGGKKGGKKKK
jgi:hypothetical protein